MKNPYNGWNISPHTDPACNRIVYIIIYLHVHTFLGIILYKSDVDVFASVDPPSYPSLMITVSAEHGPDTVTEINYSIPLKGINPNNKKIYIIPSLRHGK